MSGSVEVGPAALIAQYVDGGTPTPQGRSAAPEPPDALQVLLADPKLLALLRQAIDAPGTFTHRGGGSTGREPLTAWQARAVRAALKQVSDAPRPERLTT